MNDTAFNKCGCPHCGNNIEYGRESATMEVACPHCEGLLTLPEYQGAMGSESYGPITKNTALCPHCGKLPDEYDRQTAGEETLCSACDETFQIPPFSDDPLIVLDRYEDQFLNRPIDQKFDGDSGCHKCVPIGKKLGLVLPLAFIAPFAVLFAVLFGVEHVPGLSEQTRSFIENAAVFVSVSVIVGIVVYEWWRKMKVDKFGTLRFALKHKTQGGWPPSLFDGKPRLAMGGAVQGSVALKLIEPLEHASLGLSLILLHGTKVTQSSGGHRSSRIVYRELGRSTVLLRRDASFTPGTEQTFEFNLATPLHAPDDSNMPSLISMWGGRWGANGYV
jgi:hypothetical protein